MNRTVYKKIIISALAFCFAFHASSQEVENTFQTRTKIQLGFKPIDKVKIFITPEFRLDESFHVDKYLVDAELKYKPISLISIGGNYRLIGETNTEAKDELLNRFALNLVFSKKIKRWESSIRLKYTNYAEDQSSGQFLRFRGKLEYNIRKCKISPLISAEAYKDIDNSDWYKMRYGVGLNYKINKKQSLFTGYRFDYYLREYQNKHILNIGYKIKF